MNNTQEYHNVKWLLDLVKAAPAEMIVDRVAKEENIKKLKNQLSDMEFELKFSPDEQIV